jgi:hypothetical protein
MILPNAILLCCVLCSLSAPVSAKNYSAIEWIDLIPEADLTILLNPPASLNNIPHNLDNVSLDDFSDLIEQKIEQSKKIPTPEEQAYAAALESTNIKSEMNQQDIRIPGFVVPVEYNDAQVITEFFLVPYFGACIHVPAPPPNQVIYVKYPQGLKVTALYDPFWIEGQLSTEIVQNDIATSAYTMTAQGIKPYEEYAQ